MIEKKPFILFILLIAVLMTGCAGMPEIKEVVASDPDGADIYWGKTQFDLLKTSHKTPFIRSEVITGWESWCYQVKKEGYYDSEVICEPETSGNRYLHFELKPKNAEFAFESANKLGEKYVEQDLNPLAKKILQKAESGDAKYQNELGLFYYHGRGVPQNYKEAVKWYNRAAEQGLAEAQYNLGLMYYHGRGVPQNYKEAVKWYNRAAEQGIAGAQNNLGLMYCHGEGVFQDYVLAYKWFNLASAQGHENAKGNRGILKNRMTPSQIAEAQRLSREFRPRTGEHAASVAREPAATAIKSSGTGFFITTNGYLLTAYHVVKEATTLQICTDGRLTPAHIVRVDAANDIVLLKVDELTVARLPIISSRDVRTGLDVFTLGFPNIQLQGTEVKYTQGNISSLTGAGNDPRLFQISVPVQPGNSGGPLMDEHGQVIGLVIAKLDEIYTARTTGSLPQNVNYALKSSLVLSFLESLPELSGRLMQTKNNGLSRAQVVKQSGNAVVMVLGY